MARLPVPYQPPGFSSSRGCGPHGRTSLNLVNDDERNAAKAQIITVEHRWAFIRPTAESPVSSAVPLVAPCHSNPTRPAGTCETLSPGCIALCLNAVEGFSVLRAVGCKDLPKCFGPAVAVLPSGGNVPRMWQIFQRKRNAGVLQTGVLLPSYFEKRRILSHGEHGKEKVVHCEETWAPVTSADSLRKLAAWAVARGLSMFHADRDSEAFPTDYSSVHFEGASSVPLLTSSVSEFQSE